MRLEVFITIPESGDSCPTCGHEKTIDSDQIWNDLIGQTITQSLEEWAEEMAQKLRDQHDAVLGEDFSIVIS